MPHEKVECIETPHGRVVVRKPGSHRSPSRHGNSSHGEVPEDLRAAVLEAVHASVRAAAAAEAASKAANEALEAARRAEEILNRKPSPSRIQTAVQTMSFSEVDSGELPSVPSQATHLTGYFALDGKTKALQKQATYETILTPSAKVPPPPAGKINSKYDQIPQMNGTGQQLQPPSRF